MINEDPALVAACAIRTVAQCADEYLRAMDVYIEAKKATDTALTSNRHEVTLAYHNAAIHALEWEGALIDAVTIYRTIGTGQSK